MTSFALKAIAGTTIAIGGSIYGGYLLVTKESIREKLIKEKYIVLNTENPSEHDNDKWKEKAGKWSEMKGFLDNSDTQINTDDQKIAKIKEMCKSLLDTEVNEKNYENAKKYCAVEESTVKNN